VESVGAKNLSPQPTPLQTPTPPQQTPQQIWNEAQEYEKAGVGQDIQKAMELYGELMRDWPESEYYQQARRRLAYLQRNYVDIR
jgi:hypothetical protein